MDLKPFPYVDPGKQSKAIYLPFNPDEKYEPRTEALVHYMRSRFGKYWNDWHWIDQKAAKTRG